MVAKDTKNITAPMDVDSGAIRAVKPGDYQGDIDYINKEGKGKGKAQGKGKFQNKGQYPYTKGA